MTGKCMVWLVTTSVVRTEGGVNRMSHLACHGVTGVITIILTIRTTTHPATLHVQTQRSGGDVEGWEYCLSALFSSVGDVTAVDCN